MRKLAAQSKESAGMVTEILTKMKDALQDIDSEVCGVCMKNG
jgi:methyl-accepting chemotaxis protein